MVRRVHSVPSRLGQLLTWFLVLEPSLLSECLGGLSRQASTASSSSSTSLGQAITPQEFTGFVAKEAYPGDYLDSRDQTCVVYSDKYQFIWIKQRRAGGTSVLKALKGSLCGVNSPDFDGIGIPGLQTSSEAEHPCPNQTVLYHNQGSDYVGQCSKTPPSKEKWEKYFVFTFVRNPFDRYDSLSRYCKVGDFCTTCGQKDMQVRCRPNHWFDETGWVMSPTNKSYVDYVGHLESLVVDFRTVLREIDQRQRIRTGQGIAWTNETDLTSTWVNEASGGPSNYCSCPHCIAAVAEAYPRDVQMLGYTTPSCASS